MSVPLQAKKDFLSWFLDCYDLKNSDALSLLQYFLSNDDMMEKVRFVEDAKNTPNGIIITEYGVKGAGFRFYRYSINESLWATSDVEKSLREIQDKKDDIKEFYLQLNFRLRQRCLEFMNVVEENPYRHGAISEIYGPIAEKVLERTSREFRVRYIRELIDKALDERDFETLEKLRVQLDKAIAELKRSEFMEEETIDWYDRTHL